MSKMKWNKERAKEWLDRSNNSSLEYMNFVCLYIGLEILTKDKILRRNELIGDIKNPIQKQILDSCKNQLLYFQENEIKNEYDGPKILKDSKRQMDILKNVKSSYAEKLIAMLDICYIIRGNIVHGNKSFNSTDDRKSAENAGVFLKWFLHFILRYNDSVKDDLIKTNNLFKYPTIP
ncbi:hypothetical protein HYX08_05195 [Candidatus Woesearchaeota archaeon]|nr:hypothetical protein [Candidatus Woesearchaeota archaeon]